ncbi:LysR family transcriptional regulator [Paucibacter sp. O1-1]|uniref:LysR family transcriptional regulator n=1 Tax=Roseateles TaxID=93681 RepID=UPI0021D4C879|nr:MULTISPECIES: LysR family transcriptional regulator [unclassified Roseateles]MCU7374528.1 LysR family transcriptional regulator [Paucibacter sp. O1-1]MCZ7882259.1 LysR family transcriptional regulator [Paucibacter sp. M5-1]MDA3829530.1 LysR family transcriptional regulator [Paucibacter sp. O1-1]MDC6168875.1 LysR family transcriptional regulator [Paucibacter sp. XJ19-41]
MNFRTLDLNLLRVFDAVMAERSLTRAAQRLAMTQPAVSHALKRLRETLGEELFVRQAFGMKPTSRAEGLWPEVRAALDRLRLVLDPGDYQPDQQEQTFRIAMADATAALVLPPLVAELERLQALANIHVLPLTTRDPRSLLEQGEADFALGYFPGAVAALQAQGVMSAIRQHRLYESEYVCAMRRDHPLAELELDLDRYCAAHHLLVSFSGRPHGFVDEALTALGRSRRIMLTVNQFFTAGRIVAQSDLLTVLPASFVEATGYKQRLVERPLPMPLARVHVDMLWHLRNEERSAQRWMRERLVEAATAATIAA